jgi:Bacterial SH3 domain
VKLGTLSPRVPRRLLRWNAGPAGSRGLPTRALRTPHREAHRAPLIAGIVVLLAAVTVTAAAALPGLFATSSIGLATLDPLSSIDAPALTTTNVRSHPDPRGEVVAVLAAGRRPEVLGRSADGGWLLVATTGETRGWLPADRLDLPAWKRDALTVVAAPESPPVRVDAPAALPDITLGAVYLLKDGRIALDIRNDGDGALNDAKIPLLVTRASGETVGVLEIGPATLTARGVATVVTPIVVTATGTYTLELDRQESLTEVTRSNNSVTRLLVVGGG